MNHHPSAWGQPMTAHQQFDMYSSHQVGMSAPRSAHNTAPVQNTQQPLVTGTSVIGIKFDGGVMLAADNLASYGSLARFRDIERLHALGTHTILGAAGDMSDFQYLKKELDGLLREEDTLRHTDSHPPLSPDNLYTFLANLFYSRRSKINPLWNACLVGGWDFKKDVPFLGYVDLLGTTYTAPTLATGFGAHLAQPLLREAYEAKAGVNIYGTPDADGRLLTQEEAQQIIDECMKVLFYRDARSINKYQVAVVTKEGVTISDSKTSETSWGFAEGLRGYGGQTQ